MHTFTIHPDIELGPVHLTVSNLDRSLDYYTDILGFKLLQRQDGTATLTADGARPLLALVELPQARPKPAHSSGLYHFAVLLPGRVDLARSLRRLLERRLPPGSSDHLVSEALYLSDPDGNGIELYRDRPRDEWPRLNGQLQMAVDPLDVTGLLGTLQADDRPWIGLPAQTKIGHIHLHVANLAQAEAFYREVLGFELMVRYGASASFLSAGGYHHHVGLNIWAGIGVPPPPPEAVGLRHFTIHLPNQAEWERLIDHLKTVEAAFEVEGETIVLRDPSANKMLVTVAGRQRQ